MFFKHDKKQEKVCGSSFLSGDSTRKMTRMIEIREKTGMDKNGKYHRKEARSAPRIGLRTFPMVFEVSIKPNPALTSLSLLNKSPTSGRTTGAAPDDPIPCRTLQ